MADLIQRSVTFDAVAVQVSPPDAKGRCCLGPAVEFSGLALGRARRRLAIVNTVMRRFAASHVIDIADFDATFEVESSLPVYDAGPRDQTASRIAQNIAVFVEDGMALQVGLGKAPAALMRCLTDRRRLRLHTGMVSDGVEALVAAGALDPRVAHRTTVVLGSSELYDWATDQDAIQVRGCDEIHSPAVLARVERLISVNSALEVDLLGQCNLEVVNGRQVSGGGGATDFARAARLSPGGASIVALPSTGGGGRSRIVPRLGADSVVTLGRNDIDIVITEYGAADLRGLPVNARAEALIAIADPSARGALQDAWRDLALKLGL